MPESVKAYLRAAASVMDLMPSTNYLDNLPKKSDAQHIRNDVYNVAKDMRKVVDHEFPRSERKTA